MKKTSQTFLLTLFDKGAENPLSQFTQGTPDLVVLFIEKNETPKEISEIKAMVGDTAQSSLIVPHFYPRNSVPSVSVAETLAEQGVKVVVAGQFNSDDESITKMSRTALMEFIKTKDLTPTFVVVEMKEQEFKTAIEMKKLIETSTTGTVLTIFTADNVSLPIATKVTAVKTHMTTMQRNMWAYANSHYWPISIFEGIIGSVILLILAFVGVACLTTLQTPDKWGSESRFPCQFVEIQDP
eukprot:TRINITY_DN1483_c0_g1_i2.p1 TRINITY_DN1483_c0_g1~~TRINITY_DN1483_c0_g1_i2.p1  ORF type:complete len:240 (-),score=38.03 TRINITY_DN1483_c0_g1_i2:35-754(-)